MNTQNKADNIQCLTRVRNFGKNLLCNNSFSTNSLRLIKFCLYITFFYGVTLLLAEFYDNPFSSIGDFAILVSHWLMIEVVVFGLFYIISINKYVFSVSFPIIMVLSTIIAYYRYTLHLTLMPEVIELLLENDLRTSIDVVSWQLILWIIISFTVSFFVTIHRFRIKQIPCKWFHCIISFLIIFVPLNMEMSISAIAKRIPYSIFFTVAEYIDNHRSVASERPDFDGLVKCNTDTMTVVFIIGESLRASSMQINGYERETTPLLCKEKNVVSMSNIYSDYHLTHLSIPHFMTRSDERTP